jgi:hypothetical protein
MNPYDGPWRNRNHQLYEQYCYFDELPQKLSNLLKSHGTMFDDEWQYLLAKHRKPQRQVVVRRPHWINQSTTERYADKGFNAREKQVQL